MKKALFIVLLVGLCIGFTACEHEKEVGSETLSSDGFTGVNPPEAGGTTLPSTAQPSNSQVDTEKSTVIKKMVNKVFITASDGRQSLGQETTDDFYYNNGALEKVISSTLKYSDNTYTYGEEDFTYDVNGKVSSITRKAGKTTDKMAEEGKLEFTYDQDGKLDTLVKSMGSQKIKTKFIYNDLVRTSIDYTWDQASNTWIEAKGFITDKYTFDPSGLVAKIEGKIESNCDFYITLQYKNDSYDRLYFNETCQKSNPPYSITRQFATFTDDPNTTPYATLSSTKSDDFGSKNSCTVVEVNELDEARLVKKETIYSLEKSKCSNWQQNADKKIAKVTSYEYEDVEGRISMPPLSLISFMPNPSMQSLSNPVALFGQWMIIDTD